MTGSENIESPLSSLLLRNIDSVVEWSPNPQAYAKDNKLIGTFNMGDLARAVGFMTEGSTKNLSELMANGQRVGPSGMRKRVTKNEIEVMLVRPHTSESIVLHFPFKDKWFASTVRPDGTASDSLACHEDARGAHWTVKGMFTPDRTIYQEEPFGIQVVYDWNRVNRSLTLAYLTPHPLGDAYPDHPTPVRRGPLRNDVFLDGVGNFSVPGLLTEEEFFRNLLFPMRMYEFDVRNKTRRRSSVDDVFGILHIPHKTDKSNS